MEVIPSVSFKNGRPVIVSNGSYEEYSSMDDRASIWGVLEGLEDYEKFYFLDIDGIERNKLQSDIIKKLSTRKEIWADVGSRGPENVTDAYIAGAHRVVVGTKTLPSWEVLESAVDLSDQIILGIDHKDRVISSAKEIEGKSVDSILQHGLELDIDTFVLSNFSKDSFDKDMLRYLPEGDYELYIGGGIEDTKESRYPDILDGLILGLEEAAEWIKTN